MKRKTDIIISLGVIVLILTGIAIYKDYFRPFSTSSEWVKEELVLTSEDYNIQNPAIIKLPNGCWRMYTHGWRRGVDENNIYSFYSCDGLKWKSEDMRIKDAAMPTAVILEDGRTRLYFQRGIEKNDGSAGQALMSAISDDGLNFVIENGPRLVAGEGELKGIKTMAHFEIVKLEKGYRIYFDEGGILAGNIYKGTGWNWQVIRVRSIYSEDGLNWLLEPGIRIDVDQQFLMNGGSSVSVIKIGDKYHMYLYIGFSPWEDWKPWKRWEWSGTYEAISDDGLNFTIIDKRLVLGGDVEVVKTDDVLRMYVSAGVPKGTSAPNDIYSYTKKLP